MSEPEDMYSRDDHADNLVVREFDDSMLECYLRKHVPGSTPAKNARGFFSVILGHYVLPDFPLSLALRVENDGSYSVRLTARHQIPKRDWAQTIMLCNSWHTDHFFPTASLYPLDADGAGTSASAMLMLKSTISLSAGIHRNLFDHFTDTTIAAAMEFWRWAVEEQGFTIKGGN